MLWIFGSESSNYDWGKTCVCRVSIWIFCLLSIGLLLVPFELVGQEVEGSTRIFFNIPEQRADISLTQFAEQADRTFVFPYETVQEITTNRLVGEFSFNEAIQMLLKDTGLIPLFSETGQLTIEKGENYMQSKNKAGIAALVIGVAGTTAPIASVQAQSGVAVLEEILVTSRRYEESVSDAPVAVNVLNQSFIENNRIDRQDDIFNYTPGATYESFSKLQPTASIRGLVAPTPGNASSESSIQTVIDNVVVTKDFMKGTPLYDLSRVEVLRGPQGTSFGRNASTGLLHFVTNRPDFDETSGALNLTLGSDNRFELDGFYNLPLTDSAALRVSFNHEEEDGQTTGFTIDDVTDDVTSVGGIDGEQATAIRVQLALEPSDNFSANFKLEYSEDRDDSPIRELCNPGAGVGAFGLLDAGVRQDSIENACDTPFRAFISETDDADFMGNLDPVDFGLDREILTLSAEFSWALDNGLNITSVTGYMDGDTENLSDIIGTAADINWQGVSNEGDSLSTELRIDNVGTDSSIQWLAGVYLLEDEETRVETLNFAQRNQRSDPATAAPGATAFVPTIRETGGTGETSSWSIFGEVTFDLTDRLSLTYGGRYLEDSKDYITRASGIGVNRQLAGLPGVGPDVLGVDANGDVAVIAQQCASNAGGPPNPFCDVQLNDFAQSDTWNDYINKVSIDYEISDSINAYVLYSEGFKSGAFQPDALNVEQARNIIEPEESTNYEIGFKGEGSSYRYALTFFDITLDDVQTVNQLAIENSTAFVGIISNVGEVSTTGVEFDGAYAITDNLTISGGFAILDPEIGGNTPEPGGVIDPSTLVTVGGNTFGEVLSLDGERPGGAPEWTVNLAIDYSIRLDSGSTIDLRADFRGRDSVYFQNRNRFNTLGTGTAFVVGADPNTAQQFAIAGDRQENLLRPNISDFGAQATWTNADEDVSITIWGKNLREDVDISNVSPFVGGGINDFAVGFRGKREFGVSLNYNF